MSTKSGRSTMIREAHPPGRTSEPQARVRVHSARSTCALRERSHHDIRTAWPRVRHHGLQQLGSLPGVPVLPVLQDLRHDAGLSAAGPPHLAHVQWHGHGGVFLGLLFSSVLRVRMPRRGTLLPQLSTHTGCISAG
ncbi:unnamed protein product, partial [Ixodes pacificus]